MRRDRWRSGEWQQWRWKAWDEGLAKPALETWNPTYSQLLALAERSAQQSIRTQRKTYSSVISRGGEGRCELKIIPRGIRGQRWGEKRNSGRSRWGLLIHRPASSGSSTLAARSFTVRPPGSPVPPFASPHSEGTGGGGQGCRKEKENKNKKIRSELWRLIWTLFSELLNLFVFLFSCALTPAERAHGEAMGYNLKMSEFSGGSSSSPEAYYPTPGPARLCCCQRAAGLSFSPPTHAHGLSVNTHGPSLHTTASRWVWQRRECVLTLAEGRCEDIEVWQRNGSFLGDEGGVFSTLLRWSVSMCVRVCGRDNVCIWEVSWEDAIAKPFTNALPSRPPLLSNTHINTLSSTHTHTHPHSSNRTHFLAAPHTPCHTQPNILRSTGYLKLGCKMSAFETSKSQ